MGHLWRWKTKTAAKRRERERWLKGDRARKKVLLSELFCSMAGLIFKQNKRKLINNQFYLYTHTISFSLPLFLSLSSSLHLFTSFPHWLRTMIVITLQVWIYLYIAICIKREFVLVCHNESRPRFARPAYFVFLFRTSHCRFASPWNIYSCLVIYKCIIVIVTFINIIIIVGATTWLQNAK